MKDTITCPYCRNKGLKTQSKPRSDDIPETLVCLKCGRNISSDEIKQQLSEIVEKRIRDFSFKIGT